MYPPHTTQIPLTHVQPENLLIDRAGYIRIVDFGFCKHVPEGERTYTLCGTPAYIAYEMVKGTGYTHAVDLWALGTLIYEMLVGYAPYEGDDQMTTFRNILRGDLQFPDFLVDYQARDIIRHLLARDVVDRLGCRRDGVQEIFDHAWFEDIDWAALVAKSLPAPWLPELEGEDDVRYFESYERSEDGDGEGDGEDEGEGEGDGDEDGEEGGKEGDGEDVAALHPAAAHGLGGEDDDAADLGIARYDHSGSPRRRASSADDAEDGDEGDEGDEGEEEEEAGSEGADQFEFDPAIPTRLDSHAAGGAVPAAPSRHSSASASASGVTMAANGLPWFDGF